MTDTARLEELINESGISKTAISRKMGISYGSLRNKIKNITDFKANEIEGLSDLLRLSTETRNEIFFRNNVGK